MSINLSRLVYNLPSGDRCIIIYLKKPFNYITIYRTFNKLKYLLKLSAVQMSGKVQTVLGPVSPSELGRTLTHEHLAMEFTHFYREPPQPIADRFQSGFTLDNVGFLRQYPYSSKFNLVLNDKNSADAVLNDVKLYKKFGGGTIVENTTEGIQRNVSYYKKVSQETGVHIVAGTGFYIADLQTTSLKNTEEQLYNHMLRELTEACVEDGSVKAGFAGEIASVWPLRDFERKAIKATGELQKQVGCGVSFHPHRDPEAPFEVIRLYLEAGGSKDKAVMSHLDRTIVENTTEGIQRNVSYYKKVSQETGVHIVAGTGFYIADLQTTSLKNTEEQLYNHMLRELTEACVEDGSVKAGFAGEIASVWPLRDFERKAIKATGELQKQVGCGVSFHPHRDPEAPFEVIRLYLEAGGSKDKAVMSHLDRTLLQDDKLLEFSDLDTYCQFDLFGVEVSYYQLNLPTDMPSDAQRLDKIKLLVGHGKEDKVLMSHDIHTKHRLIDFGGHGYSHIINNVLPRMGAKGFSKELIDKITIDNPAKWLTIDI